MQGSNLRRPLRGLLIPSAFDPRVTLASLAHPGLHSFACYAGSLALKVQQAPFGGNFVKLSMICSFVILTLSSAALAQDQKKDPCANAQSQLEMNMCWGKEYKAADARLNSAYREFTAKLNPEETAQLKAAQLAWIKFRDANCEFVADAYKGGSIRPMIAAMCLADVTNARTSELKAQMKEREEP